MKQPRQRKRSVSPFGIIPEEPGPFQYLFDAFAVVFPGEINEEECPMETWVDGARIPMAIENVAEAAANAATDMENLCQFLVKYWTEFEEKGLSDILFQAMTQLFGKKTDLFLVDHHNQESCEKLEWPEDHRDIVLFSKERDYLLYRFFAPVTEKKPGLFSAFVSQWMESTVPDRLLHFVDFCVGSKNPTLDHHLLFTHPALSRVVTNKSELRALLENAQPFLSRFSSPTLENDVRQSLSL